jgi:hypothetical protein
MTSPSFALQAGIQLFFLLVMGHFLGDFGLQSDRMAQEKCSGKDRTLPWQWWLTSHAAIHGLLVGLISGVAWLGLSEWIAHILIDYGKCRHRYGLGVDQALHMGCKAVWVGVMIANGWLDSSAWVRLA